MLMGREWQTSNVLRRLLCRVLATIIRDERKESEKWIMACAIHPRAGRAISNMIRLEQCDGLSYSRDLIGPNFIHLVR